MIPEQCAVSEWSIEYWETGARKQATRNEKHKTGVRTFYFFYFFPASGRQAFSFILYPCLPLIFNHNILTINLNYYLGTNQRTTLNHNLCQKIKLIPR